jgi:hypothetical protein
LAGAGFGFAAGAAGLRAGAAVPFGAASAGIGKSSAIASVATAELLGCID